MDYTYPVPKPEPVVYDEIDKAVIAPLIIELVNRGALNYSGFEDGARLPKIHVCSIICANQNLDPKDVSGLYDEIEAEKKTCEALHPCEYTTLASFKTALGGVMTYLSVDKWIADLKIQFKVTTWTAMTEWCAANYSQEPE